MIKASMLNSMHMSNFYEPAMKCSWGFLYTILFLTICRGISRHFIFAMLSQIFSYFCSCYDLRIHSCFHMPYSYSPWFFPFTFSPIDCTIWNFLLLDLKYLNNVTVMSFVSKWHLMFLVVLCSYLDISTFKY